VEIHFDLGHVGTATGFEFKVFWGSTVLVERMASAAELMIAGKGESAVYSGGAQLRSESWGNVRRLRSQRDECHGQHCAGNHHRLSSQDVAGNNGNSNATKFHGGALSGAV